MKFSECKYWTSNWWFTVIFIFRYASLVKEVLTSVQKTEESLRNLKKIREKSAGVSTLKNQGTSDDEKIRIQLHIDVLSYIQMVTINKFILYKTAYAKRLKYIRQYYFFCFFLG